MRYVCVHGHFYQPPRENPWLEAVEVQDSADPFHDWNERVTAECYRPNAWSRIQDPEGFITRIQNNYSRMSFNFGPTLLHWLETRAADVYEAILRADRESRERFGGHGSALAQAYNHAILPLANGRDKRTQIRWGIRDFKRRFERDPEGMWLPETAVDLETLRLLSEEGIRFTILAPNQAARFRPIGGGDWTDAAGGIPPTRPYRVAVPGTDRAVTVFFYDGPISHDLAFGGVLNDGRAFAERLLGAFTPAAEHDPELVHVATDGETYGHHHQFGDMALAVALRTIEEGDRARLTNYGEYLEHHPPTFEAEIRERTSWSCAHGVERWRSDCGCSSGMHPGWQQSWRTPLRESLDRLRDELDPRFETRLGALLRDPWAVRDEYIDLAGRADRSGADEFLSRHAPRPLSEEETERALELLELERHVQQMYTSCGWFFDDLGGIETVQCLQYAARAIQLAERVFGEPFEAAFERDLAPARGNVIANGDGAATYRRFALPARIDLNNVCGHYALSSLFENYSDRAPIFCYLVERIDRKVLVLGAARLALGQAWVRSLITREHARLTYAALHIGGHNLIGGVRPFQGDAAYARTLGELAGAFEQGDLARSIHIVEEQFGGGTYSLRLLFRDEQRRIVALLLEATRQSVEASFRQIYETTAPILRYLTDAHSAAPAPLRAATEYFANMEVRRALEGDAPNAAEAAGWLRQLSAMGLTPDVSGLGYAWSRAAERLLDRFAAHPEEEGTLRNLLELVGLLDLAPLKANMSGVQNRYFALLHGPFGAERARAAEREPNGARRVLEEFRQLGAKLRVRVE
jgi:alpha-amylase/alpha-mannosidase (GH57 family)